MPRSVDVSAESPASVEQFHAAFSDERYWRDRLAVNDSGGATLDSLAVAADGAVNVAMTLSPLPDWLPGPIARLQHGNLRILHTEVWSRHDDGRLRGRIDFTFSGVPLAGLGALVLTPVPAGSLMRGTATVEVRVPLVGGTIERFIGGHLPEGILSAERFTTEWIAAHS